MHDTDSTFVIPGQAPLWEPSPEEIREACRKIQAEWTPKERRQRMVGRARPKPGLTAEAGFGDAVGP